MRETKKHTIIRLGSTKGDILSVINQHAPISRSKLAELFGLSFTAIAKIVNEFIEYGLVREVGKGHDTKLRGKKSNLLCINEDYGYIIGSEITDVRIKSVLADFGGNLKVVKRTVFEKCEKEYLLQAILSNIEELVKENLGNWDKIKGICIGMHGLVDYKNGISITFPSCDDWGNIPLKSILEERFNVPVILDARLYAATFAELLYGEGKYNPNFIYFNSGPGNGFNIGIVLNGEILRGSGGFAGQFGHLVVEPNGPRCFCGSRGCLVTLASPLTIEKKAIEALESGVQSSLGAILRENNRLFFKDIAEASKNGDKISLTLIEEAGKYLGLGFSYVINLFAPSVIVLAGVLNEARDILLDSIKREARLHTVPRVFENVMFKFSELEEDIAARGSVALVLREHLTEVTKI